ncbi:MAG: PadR family transcriptional regulator [Eubacteriales bacterium]
MDKQLKKGLLENCVLAVLMKSDSYGYQMVKDISEYIDISESTLYPILRRLENAEAVTIYTVEHNMRLRKYYKITSNGKEQLHAFIKDFEDVIEIYKYIKGVSENE